MRGLEYDFETGDIAFNSDGSWRIGDTDNQNVTLISVSQVCRITVPELGAQIGSRLINIKQVNASSILSDAKKQCESDGARDVRIRFTEDNNLIFSGRYDS